jgi:hypothetical protein
VSLFPLRDTSNNARALQREKNITFLICAHAAPSGREGEEDGEPDRARGEEGVGVRACTTLELRVKTDVKTAYTTHRHKSCL